MNGKDETSPQCPVPSSRPGFSGETVNLYPAPAVADYREAMQLAEVVAGERLVDYMLLSWYDRDRNFESPQHVDECHQESAVPGYVDYALYRGANLKVDVEQGRFVFYYLSLDL